MIDKIINYRAFLFVSLRTLLEHELTHLSQTMHKLSEILFFSATFCCTSISIGQISVQALQAVQLSDSIGVILNNEYFEKSPEMVINGQSNLQYDRLPE